MSKGKQTSEFKLTVAVQLAGVVLEALAMVLHALTEASLGGTVVQSVLIVCGVLMQIVTLLGYQKARTQLKAVSITGDMAQVTPPPVP